MIGFILKVIANFSQFFILRSKFFRKKTNKFQSNWISRSDFENRQNRSFRCCLRYTKSEKKMANPDTLRKTFCICVNWLCWHHLRSIDIFEAEKYNNFFLCHCKFNSHATHFRQRLHFAHRENEWDLIFSSSFRSNLFCCTKKKFCRKGIQLEKHSFSSVVKKSSQFSKHLKKSRSVKEVSTPK